MTTDYTHRAVRAMLSAARGQHDFAGWLAQVLAKVAGQLGSADALTAGRPGSWESALIAQLVSGTVGYDGESLPGPISKLTDQQVREIRERWCDGFGGVTQAALAAEFKVSPSTISSICSYTTWEWLH